MRKTLLRFSPPEVGDEEIREVASVLQSGWLSTGQRAQDFEEEFRRVVGAPAAVAVNSCTAAMHVALKAMGVGPGDEVIATPMTFVASVEVIEHVGAKPVLVDIDPETMTISPELVGAALKGARGKGKKRGRVKAMIPVDVYGHPCEWDSLLDIARQYRLAIVEDAAHALGASYHGRPVGSLANAAGVPAATCFSFYATKNLTTGEGGMLTSTPEIAEEARVWSLHGITRGAWKREATAASWRYEVVHPGFKYNMSDIMGAIGLAQLRKLDTFQARRRQIVRRYQQAFASLGELQLPVERAGVEHAWHLYVVRLRPEMFGLPRSGPRVERLRDDFITGLRKRNVESSVHFMPVHMQRYYRKRYRFRPLDFPVAYGESQRIVSLPLYTRMTDEDVEDVIREVTETVKSLASGRKRR